MKTVNTSNLPLIDYRKLEPFQGELKFLSEDNYNKLLLSMEKNGFFVPMFVWFDNKTPYILDAHQRLRVLTNENIEFENTGFEVPYVEVRAENRADAASKLLVLSSQYGTITQEGLDEFVSQFELPEVEVGKLTNFDGIFNFDNQEDPHFEPLDDDEDRDNRLDQLKEIECPKCGYHATVKGFGEYSEKTSTS